MSLNRIVQSRSNLKNALKVLAIVAVAAAGAFSKLRQDKPCGTFAEDEPLTSLRIFTSVHQHLDLQNQEPASL